MILGKKQLSMAESMEFLEKEGDSEADARGFIKKFIKLKFKDAQELRKKLEALELIKMREEYLIKVIDLMPENAEDLNKIFNDTSLDEDETKKILDTIKEFK